MEYVYACTFCNRAQIFAFSISEENKEAKIADKTCSNCGRTGTLRRVWTGRPFEVIYKAGGFSKTTSLEEQRKRGEFLVSRKD